MKIIRLQAQNVKRLKAIDITPGDDPIVQITGRNGGGKTSLLDCILYGLGGKDQIDAMPVRRGERTAKITIDLGKTIGEKDWEVIREWSESTGTVLTVKNKWGQEQQKLRQADRLGPQGTIDNFLAKITLDPLAFVRLGATVAGRRQQAAQLREMVELPFDLDELEAKQKLDYEQRKKLNAMISERAAQAAGQEPLPAGLPEEPLDVSELSQELQRAGEQNVRIEGLRSQHMRLIGEATQHETHAQRCDQDIAEMRRQIAELEKQQEALRKKKLKLQKEADELEIPDPVDVAAASQAITDATRTNNYVRLRDERRAKEKELQALKDERDGVQERMNERDRTRVEGFAQAKMPVPNLSFAEDGPYWNGLPLEQASGAEQLRVSMAVAMATNPKLRILRIIDGSLLDEESMKLVRQLAEENDFQAWIEMVDSSGEVGFVLSEGEVVSTPQSRAAAAVPVEKTKAKRGKGAA